MLIPTVCAIQTNKVGTKAWALMMQSFYLVDFNIYTGKDNDNQEGLSLATRVVTDLVKDLFGRHHHVYFDNFFPSEDLIETLLANKTYMCGTVRLNCKGLPVSIKGFKLKHSDEFKKIQKGRLMAVTWCEKKRQVNVLSTGNKTDNISITRKGKGGVPDQTYPKTIAIQSTQKIMMALTRTSYKILQWDCKSGPEFMKGLQDIGTTKPIVQIAIDH